MTRFEFQELADVRIKEAGVLLAAGLWDGAYYLAGYAVECALKACIAKLTKADDFPEKDAAKYYTHKIEELAKLAGILAAIKAEGLANSTFRNFWATITDWSETSRYERKSKDHAEELFGAITDPTNGVLPWIQRIW